MSTCAHSGGIARVNIGAPIELLQISRYATHSLAELVEVERILLANALA